jgi:hypothetical protein
MVYHQSAPNFLPIYLVLKAIEAASNRAGSKLVAAFRAGLSTVRLGTVTDPFSMAPPANKNDTK